MNMIQSQSTTHTSSISQAAAVAALNGPQDFIAPNNAMFRERRDLVVAMLNQAAGLDLHAAGRRLLRLSVVCRRHRQEHAGRQDASRATTTSSPTCWRRKGVACVQGSAFGLSPFFRISYATATRLLEEACRRIQRACAALR